MYLVIYLFKIDVKITENNHVLYFKKYIFSLNNSKFQKQLNPEISNNHILNKIIIILTFKLFPKLNKIIIIIIF